MELKIKELGEGQLTQVIPLFIDCFKELPWEEIWSYECVFNRLSDVMQANGFIGFIIYFQEQPIGCVMGNVEHWYYGLSYQIKEFFIDSKYQRKGIGSRLLAHLQQNLDAKGIQHQTLYTLNQPDTIGFYERNGFVVDQRLVAMKNKCCKQM